MISRHTYMINGGAGSGKTTLSLHFLTQVPDQDTLYILDKNSQTIRWMAAGRSVPICSAVQDINPRLRE